MEKATFAAGPFWEAEDAFRHIDGVLATNAGYAGGRTVSPSHEEVAAGATGHAEAVEVAFDPEQVSYEGLLELFWGIHDPDAGEAGGDGPHRSAIFFHDAGQEAAARESLARFTAAAGGRPPATRILPAGPFYPAEEQHQHYYEKRFG